MKIGVISDTHGNMTAIKKAAEAAGAVDLWLHCGDYSWDSDYLKRLTGVQVIAAKGNCDGGAPTKLDEFLNLEGLSIWLTHGHRYHVNQGLAELRFWARQYEAAIVVFGHTHIPELIKDAESLLFNPGSASLPSNNQKPTFGIITIDGDNISACQIELL
ncbi:MAG: metallophosphoesterase [Veillonellaceae bacterium]|nr:metallophosphoesterase [Veillonellaceae bacterium]